MTKPKIIGTYRVKNEERLLEKSLKDKDDVILGLENSIEQLNDSIEQLNGHINFIHNSKIWKLMQFLFGHSKN